MVEDLGHIAGEYDNAHKSVHRKGKAERLTDPVEMRRGLDVMFDALEPGRDRSGRAAMVDRSLSKAIVCRVVIEQMTGKGDVPAPPDPGPR